MQTEARAAHAAILARLEVVDRAVSDAVRTRDEEHPLGGESGAGGVEGKKKANAPLAP